MTGCGEPSPAPVVLAILAHPDDETYRCGGTLALLARRGVRVHVLTATRGEAGSCGHPPLCRPGELPLVRERELRCACAALGIEPPILLDYRDGALATVDEDEAVARVLAVARALRPQALLTWPAHGLSGHPDHMAVSRWAARAFDQAAVWGSGTPAALYYLAMPRSLAAAMALTRLHTVPDGEISLVVDVSPVWEEKMAAIRCHRTQLAETPILAAPPAQQRRFLGSEYFLRAASREGVDPLSMLH